MVLTLEWLKCKALGRHSLKNLGNWLKQNYNYQKIWNEIKHFKQIKLRKIPKNSYISADALIIFMQNKKQALNLRNELIKENIMTKILPEAISGSLANGSI